MSRWAAYATTVIALVLVSALGAQSMDESMQKAMADYSAWMDKLAEFTKGIEFDEGDLTSFIEHSPEMQSLRTTCARCSPSRSTGAGPAGTDSIPKAGSEPPRGSRRCT